MEGGGGFEEDSHSEGGGGGGSSRRRQTQRMRRGRGQMWMSEHPAELRPLETWWGRRRDARREGKNEREGEREGDGGSGGTYQDRYTSQTVSLHSADHERLVTVTLASNSYLSSKRRGQISKTV